MKTKLFFISTLCMLFLFVSNSCKKEASPIIYDTYFPLKVGNYWIYEEIRVDFSGTETSMNRLDSNYVEKDTVINGDTYYKVHKPNIVFPDYFELLKDSMHYIVNVNGKILFSSQDFSNVYYRESTVVPVNDTLYTMECKMESASTSVVVASGTYMCKNSKETYSMYPGWSAGTPTRYRNFYYAKDIGIIEETIPFFVSSTHYIEKRLVRYQLN